MKIRFRRSSLNFLLIALLAASLVTLAVLQYRWIGQTSDAEREKMRGRAELAAENFSRDFNRELTRAFLLLQVNQNSVAGKNQDDFAPRYERWLATAPYPKMVSRVFIAERGGRDDENEIRLSVYNDATRLFEDSAWLPKLDRVRSEIEQNLSGENAETSAGKNGVEFLASDVPALVIPISAVNLPDLKNIANGAAQNRTPLDVSVRRVGYTVLLLDADYIKKELLPSLVARHFNFADGADSDSGYDVIVTSRDEPPRVFYQSDSIRERAEAPIEAVDIKRDLFALRFDEIKNLLPDTATRLQPQSPPANDGKPQRSVSVSVVTAQSSGIVNPGTTSAFFTNQRGSWRLLAQHRNGSLDAAVETARWRNLLVSFGILLLLAASGVLLIVLLNRERVLARRQNAFAASVSHELRTPLAVIRATSENIADGIITDSARVKEYGSLIGEEERRLSAMVEQMLELAGAGQAAQIQPDELRRENVGEIVEAALKDYRTELDKNNFDVCLQIEPDLPEIRADRDALRRAFGNLIGNAVKYGNVASTGEEKSRIEITARGVENGASKQVEVIVKDNGAGIEKKDLPHIFKLFYRGRTATEAQIKGSGIGLSLVKQIVEAHGGTVQVASTPGRETAFTIRLPEA